MDDEREQLRERARELGATEEDISRAISLGELILGLTLLPRSGRTIGEVVARDGLDQAKVLRLLRSTGMAADIDAPVSDAEIEAIHMFAAAFELLGEDMAIQLGRVAGQSMARVAEAVVTAFRLRFEVPRLSAGVPYPEVVDRYTEVAATLLPSFVGTLDVLLRQNILAIAERMWSTDEEGAAVTLPRAIGFADMVGYTAAAAAMSIRELAATLVDFDERTVAAARAGGGQILKTNGDEAMFVANEALTACRIARDIVRSFADAARPPVRIGIGAGNVVSVFGDMYGTEVNLAARLCSAAEPGEVLVSEAVANACGDDFTLEAVGPLALKGFADPVGAYRLT